MNEVSQLWSVPWHTLQKNLAEGIGETAAHTLKIVHVESVTVSGNSWLGRARRRGAVGSSTAMAAQLGQ